MDNGIADVFAKSFNKFKNYLRGAFSELNEYDAEDIVSQTALAMLDRDDTDSIEYMSAYIYSALRNTAKNHFRKRKYEAASDGIDRGGDSAEDELIKAELKQQIWSALSILDEKSRFVLVETELYGKSYKEVQAVTGEPIGTLLSRKSRAVKKLVTILDEYYDL
ncbi:MAG: sigma-70 family RNA polymerase sigma factor [Eubacteriales bacterium]|nr:sigma-70 family RNA polymerase sigma factor [Eubacteriales bacterium]